MFLMRVLPVPPAAEGERADSVSVLFWNVENFFAPGKMEGKRWSRRRFYTKCNAVAKTILLAGDSFGALPDLVGLCEIGDSSVMRSLVYATPLRKLDYRTVHYESPDRRGIDCALLYRRSRFRLMASKPCHLYDGAGAVMPTRDILLAVFRQLPGGPEDTELLAVLVNHHPSKVGGGSEARRAAAMARLAFLVDSLKSEGIRRIVAVGDFNDEISWAPAMRPRTEHAPSAGLAGAGSAGAPGTIKFQGRWEKIDGCPVLEGMEGREYIFAPRHLTEKDAAFGGEKPRRTFSGPRYLGGVSDHYPVFFIVRGR